MAGAHILLRIKWNTEKGYVSVTGDIPDIMIIGD